MVQWAFSRPSGVARYRPSWELSWTLYDNASRQPVEPVTVSRVRFKKLIEPHDHIRVEAVPKQNKEGVMAFRILMGDELVSSGVLTIRPAE